MGQKSMPAMASSMPSAAAAKAEPDGALTALCSSERYLEEGRIMVAAVVELVCSIVVRTWTGPDLDRGPGPEVRKVRDLAAGPGPAATFLRC